MTRSSAKIIVYKLSEPILSFKVSIKCSIKTLNNAGDKGEPYGTPLVN